MIVEKYFSTPLAPNMVFEVTLQSRKTNELMLNYQQLTKGLLCVFFLPNKSTNTVYEGKVQSTITTEENNINNPNICCFFLRSNHHICRHNNLDSHSQL